MFRVIQQIRALHRKRNGRSSKWARSIRDIIAEVCLDNWGSNKERKKKGKKEKMIYWLYLQLCWPSQTVGSPLESENLGIFSCSHLTPVHMSESHSSLWKRLAPVWLMSKTKLYIFYLFSLCAEYILRETGNKNWRKKCW